MIVGAEGLEPSEMLPKWESMESVGNVQMLLCEEPQSFSVTLVDW